MNRHSDRSTGRLCINAYGDTQSPAFFCFFLTGSSSSFEAFATGFGFGLGLGLGAGSESTSIVSSASPPFFGFLTDCCCFALTFFGFFSSSSSPSSLSPPPPPLAFFFFLAGEDFLSSSFDFAFAFFFGRFFIRSRSPDASEAVAPPSESELDSLGEPSSEDEAWKSSSVVLFFVRA